MSEKTKELPPLSTASVLLAYLAELLGIKGISQQEGCCEIEIDPQWKVAVNPHNKPEKHDGVTIEPFNTFVTFNGWPAGTMTPFAGCFVESSRASEDNFIRAIAQRIERETDDGKMPDDVISILKDAGVKI